MSRICQIKNNNEDTTTVISAAWNDINTSNEAILISQQK